MSRNRRKNANTIRVATFFWWLVIFFGLGVLGLSYVSIKNQTIAFGEQRRLLENELRDLNDRNRALTSQETALISRSVLQAQVDSGVIKLVEIDPALVVRLNHSTLEPALQESLASSNVLAQK